MKISKIISIVIVMAFMFSIISVDAAPLSSLMANLPWTTAVVDEKGEEGVGQYVSIAHHPRNGSAYMSFYDAQNGDLMMAHEVTPGTGDCLNNDWDCEVVASSGDVGKYSSIDVAWVIPPLPGRGYTKIGISFYDDTQDSLRYAEYQTGTGWTIQEVDDYPQLILSGSRGTYSSLKFTSSNLPIIAYHTVANYLNVGGIKLASYNISETGTGCSGYDYEYWNCETIDEMTGQREYGTHVSLDLYYDSVVQVAFYDSKLSQLIWAYRNEYEGTCSNDSWKCVTVDDDGDVGKFVSLHAPDSSSDRMRIAYFDATSGKVKYAVRVNSGGNCTSGSFDCFYVDSIGNPIGPIGLSLTVDQEDQPIIAYMDASNEFTATGLKVARPASAYGKEAGNCGEDPPGEWVKYWQCETIDRDVKDELCEASHTAVSVSPNGLATIAYYESDSKTNAGRVKIAQQHFTIFLPVIKK